MSLLPPMLDAPMDEEKARCNGETHLFVDASARPCCIRANKRRGKSKDGVTGTTSLNHGGCSGCFKSGSDRATPRRLTALNVDSLRCRDLSDPGGRPDSSRTS
jgi:hypothetical protein